LANAQAAVASGAANITHNEMKECE